jgi:long-chain fatty acid transport protein
MVGNPAAIFWNPAALGLLNGRHLLVDVEAIAGQGKYQRAPDALAADYPEVTANVLFALPFIGYVDDFGLKDWRFGFGVYVPFGSGGSWDPTGPQRYHLIKGAEGSLFITGTATYKILPNFFAGAGVSYVFSALQGEVALDLVNVVGGLLPPGFGPVPTESPLFEAHAETKLMTGHDVAFNGGIFYQPSPDVDLGLSFLLPINVTVSGPIDVTLPDALALGQPVLAVLGFDGRVVRADGEISMTRPPLIMAGGAWRSHDQVTIETVLIYVLSYLRDTMKSELFGTGIPYLDAPEGTSRRDTGAENSFQARLGAKYQLNPHLLFGGYLTYIHSGIPTAYANASNVGFSFVIPTWLTRYDFTERHGLSASLSPIIAFTRKVDDSVFSSLSPAGSGVGLPPANGTYRGFGLQLGVAYNFRF